MEAAAKYRPKRNNFEMNTIGFIFVLLGSLLISVNCEDSLIISHAPSSIKFNSIEAFKSSDIADIFSGMLAFTTAKEISFQSLAPVNPLTRPEAIWVFDIHKGTENTDLNIKGQKFPMENYGKLWNQYNNLKDRTSNRYSMYQKDSKPVLVKINVGDELYAEVSEQEVLSGLPQTVEARMELALKDPQLAQIVKDGSFNFSTEADVELFVEIGTVKLVLKALLEHKKKLRDDIPDIFWVELRSLVSIAHRYGSDSYQTKEACRLIEQLVLETVSTMNEVYDENAVVAVFTQTPIPELNRNARNLLAETTVPPTPEPDDDLLYNLAYKFDQNFSVAFALVAFTTVVLILTVLGVSVAMWFLDPGRDSIIYRMTSQRMKKD